MSEPQKHSPPPPRLRNLQFSPIKQQDEQYIVLWDPTGLSPEKLIIPLNYFYLMQFFDGEHSLEQIGAEYLKKFGEFILPDRMAKLITDLDEKLFLEGERFDTARKAAIEAYRAVAVRPAAYTGKSYAAEPEQLKRELDGFFTSKEGPDWKPSANAGKALKGIVAPHYDLRQGGPIYAWAYKEVQEAEVADLFVLLGTCQAGLENGYALTDKDFETPLGKVAVNRDVLDVLRKKGGASYFDEELSHKNEHSLEFQLPFLQHTVGTKKPFTVVPILTAFAPDDLAHPEFLGNVERFIRLMRDVLAESGKAVCFVASTELAHIGLRYGDNKPPTDFSFHKCMQWDMEMLKHVEQLDPDAFASFIRKEGNARRISGFAAIYTMLKLMKAEKGEVLRYDRGVTDQFNSTVTYASVVFY
jgi:AmmeMemoRadiSam system protein B